MARGFRESVAFDQDCCLGGNEAEARALDASQPLEMNGVTFSGKDGKDFTLATLDALYPGALAGMFDPAQHIFCASHTHYAPMIDANKGLSAVIRRKAVNAGNRRLPDGQRNRLPSTNASFLRHVFRSTSIAGWIIRVIR